MATKHVRWLSAICLSRVNTTLDAAKLDTDAPLAPVRENGARLRVRAERVPPVRPECLGHAQRFRKKRRRTTDHAIDQGLSAHPGKHVCLHSAYVETKQFGAEFEWRLFSAVNGLFSKAKQLNIMKCLTDDIDQWKGKV